MIPFIGCKFQHGHTQLGFDSHLYGNNDCATDDEDDDGDEEDGEDQDEEDAEDEEEDNEEKCK